MFKTFLSYYKPYKGILLFLVIGSLLRALLELFFPYVVKLMLEQQLPLKNLPLLLEWSAALLAMYLVNFGMHFSIIYWAQSMSYSMERDMRRDLFSHLQKLSFGFYDKNKSGQLLSRLTSDLSEINGFAGNAPIDLIVCGLTMLGTMVILIYMNPMLGSLIAFLLLVKAVHTVFVNLRMKKAFFANRVAMGEVTGKAAESINGVRLIKAFAGERSDMAQFMEKADAYLKVCKKILQNNILFRRQYDFLQQLYQCGDISSGRPADKSGADELRRAGGLLPLRGPVYETADAAFRLHSGISARYGRLQAFL